MKRLFLALLIIVAVVWVIGSRHPRGPDAPQETVVGIGRVYLGDVDGAKLATSIRALGYHCEKALTEERLKVRSDGSNVYKIMCGFSGPFYAVTVYPNGKQSLVPIED